LVDRIIKGEQNLPDAGLNPKRFISMKLPLWSGRAESVSMKWAWGFEGSRNALLNGDATAKRLRVVKRWYAYMAVKGSIS